MLSPIQTRTRWVTEDRVITLLVVLFSLCGWGWNSYISFFNGSGELTSKHVHDFVTRFPIVVIPIMFGLGCWPGFRQWLKNHPWGLAYLAMICGHMFWPLPG
jgi:hypothetical protein